MKKYSEYKDTGLSWCSSIPSHWDCKKIDSLFMERKTKVSDKEYSPLSVTKQGVLPQLADVAKTDNGDNRKLVLSGDFVINSRSDRKGSSGVSTLDGSVSVINIVLQPRSNILAKFIHYLLKSNNFVEEYYRNGRGIVADLWTTRYSEMRTIYIPIPSTDEQEKIVAYLDNKISKIDQLIDIKRKEIAVLEEYRQGVINKAVTRGLNPDVELKDSGIAIIGNIPTNWLVKNFAKLAKVCSNLVSPNDYQNYMQVSSDKIEKNTGRLLKCCTVKESGIISDNHLFFEGQILYSKIRPLLNKVTIAPFSGLCSADMYPIETSLHTKYLMYYMLSNKFVSQLEVSKNRVKMPKLNKEELGSMKIIVPSKTEQIKIANYLDRKCNKFEMLKYNLQKQISLLEEYRTRLISDVVTGQIDVR